VKAIERFWQSTEAHRITSRAAPPPLNIWQWAAANVDYSRAPNYDTAIHGPYDPEFMSYWKEPTECLTDPDIREVTILKATRSGGSENVLLNMMRYAVGVRPQRTLYITSDQLSAERFMAERIKRGLRCTPATARALREATTTQHDIAFQTMDLRVTWPRAKQAFKQDGWALVLCDELSTWPEYRTDMARRRMDTYPFPHIVFLSTPDPAQQRASEEDPIFIEYWRGDRRRWFCPDPAGGEFCFEMGIAGKYGLQWDSGAKRENGEWDYDRVEASAYYLTPGGARIDNAQRRAVVGAGRWAPTNPAAPVFVRSYHVTSFMVPFAAGNFGRIAVAFLKAKHGGPFALRSFVYEYLAEPWTQDVDRINDDVISRRETEYLRGQSYFDLHKDYKDAQRRRVMTVDVQKDYFVFLIREWCMGGASCLVDWGTAGTWDEIDSLATKHRAEVLVDSGYGERTMEVYDECIRRKFIPAKGDERATAPELPWRKSEINPYEGTRRARDGDHMGLVLWHTDTFKLMLLARMRGEVPGWFVYRRVERDYKLQTTAEERTPKGWVKRRRANHLWDCEVLQMVAATAYGLVRPPQGRIEPSAEQIPA
jgi:phage terminase large subunit GpA-like protein